MTKAEDAILYRRRAEHCIELALALRDEEQKIIMLGVAQAWLRLAGRVGRNATVDVVSTSRGAAENNEPNS